MLSAFPSHIRIITPFNECKNKEKKAQQGHDVDTHVKLYSDCSTFLGIAPSRGKVVGFYACFYAVKQ